MATTLTKGANTSLTAAVPGLRRVLVGVGWAPPTAEYQLDVSVLLCGADGKVPSPDFVVFASQVEQATTTASSSGAEAGTDDEQFEIDLDEVPGYVDRIVFAAAIFDAAARRQTFGQLDHLFIRVADLTSGAELVRYTLDHDCAGETALVFGELYRHSSGWKFRAVGQGWWDGLTGLARGYGADVR